MFTLREHGTPGMEIPVQLPKYCGGPNGLVE
jgi:hypothetical protein